MLMSKVFLLYCRGRVPGCCMHLLCGSLHWDIQGQAGAGLEGPLPGAWGPCLSPLQPASYPGYPHVYQGMDPPGAF